MKLRIQYILTLLCIAIFWTNGLTQNNSIAKSYSDTFSTVEKIEGREGYDLLMIKDSVIIKYNIQSLLTLVSPNNKIIYVHSYDSESLKKISTDKIETKNYLGRYEMLLDILSLGANQYLVCIKGKEIYLRKFNIEKPHIEKKSKVLGQYSKFRENDFRYFHSRSENNRFQVLYFRSKGKSGKFSNIFHLYDRSTQEWHYYEHEDKRKKISPHKLFVSNSGDFGLVGLRSKGFGGGVTLSLQTVLYHFHNTNELDRIDIEYDQYRASGGRSTYLKFNQQGMNIAGLGNRGLYTQFVQRDLQVGKRIEIEFESEFITEFRKNNLTSSALPRYAGAYIINMFSLSDQSQIIICGGVHNFDLSQNNDAIHETDIGIKRHLFALRIDKNGGLIWKKNYFINKKGGNFYYAYKEASRVTLAFQREQDIFLVYNEDLNDLKIVTQVSKLNINNGELNVAHSIESKEAKLFIDPAYCFRINDEVMFLYANEKNKRENIGFFNY